MNDTFIKNKIERYFKIQTMADLTEIEVFVREGEVKLEGVVATNSERDFAESIVKRMWEVKRVISNISLMSEAATLPLPPLHRIFQTA